MYSQYYKFLTLVADIVNALTDNIGKIVKFKYFVNTVYIITMTRKLLKCIILIDNIDNFV